MQDKPTGPPSKTPTRSLELALSSKGSDKSNRRHNKCERLTQSISQADRKLSMDGNENRKSMDAHAHRKRKQRKTDPGMPEASMWLASVTSLLQASYCHFLSPITPHSTRPVWIPTRIVRSTSVASRTALQHTK